METAARSQAAPAAQPAARHRREVWVLAAWFLLGLEIAWILYLAMRNPGRSPVLAYSMGPWVLTSLAALIGVLGAVTSFLNPPVVRRRRLVALAVLAFVIGTASYPLPFPTRHEGQVSAVEFQLPVQGEWTVVWGGDSPRNLLAHHLASRRFGLDLTVIRDGAVHSGDGSLESHFAFGQPALAPFDGLVVGTQSSLPDRLHGEGAEDPVGNHLVLQVAPEQFVVLGNLRKGSVRFGPGAIVEQGEIVAEVGSSASSRFTRVPHLAIHLQDAPEPRWGQPVPWRFRRYLADGQRVEQGVPSGQGLRKGPQGLVAGERIEALP